MAELLGATPRAWSLAAPLSPPGLVPVASSAAGGGTTRVAVEAFAVSRLDATVLEGAMGAPERYPFVPGTEGVGRVVASERFVPGTRVRIRGAGVGITRDGTWAEEAVVPDAALVPVAEGVPAAVACTFFSPVATAIGVVEDVARVEPGERVMVTGAAGSVGALVAHLARARGAAVVGVASGPVSSGRLGPAVDEPVTAVEVPGVAAVDVLVDVVGGELLPAALDRVRPGGRVVLVGYAGSPRVELDLRRLIVADVGLTPFNLVVREEALRERADRALAAVVAGLLPLAVDAFGFDDVPRALAAVAGGPGGRRVAVVTGSPGPGDGAGGAEVPTW